MGYGASGADAYGHEGKNRKHRSRITISCGSLFKNLKEDRTDAGRLDKLLEESEVAGEQEPGRFRRAGLCRLSTRFRRVIRLILTTSIIPSASRMIMCGVPDLHDPNAFAVRVVGDSMEPKFKEGDIVVFLAGRRGAKRRRLFCEVFIAARDGVQEGVLRAERYDSLAAEERKIPADDSRG